MFGNPDKNEGYVTFNTTKYGERVTSETTQASGVAYFGSEEIDMGYLEAKQWIDSIIQQENRPLLPFKQESKNPL